MNNIFIISSNIDRLCSVHKYFNIYNDPTSMKFSVILDNRHMSESDIEKANTLGWDIHYTTDVIDKCKDYFDDPQSLTDILSVYGVAIKWLTFIYAYKVLGIKKVMMSDDDVLILKPLDHYFKHDYVFKNEGSQKFSDQQRHEMLNIIRNIDGHEEFLDSKKSINSGQLIHTWNDDSFLDFINKIVNKHTVAVFKNIMTSPGSRRSTKGAMWTTEQYVYALYRYVLNKKGIETSLFGGDVKLLNTKKIEPESMPIPAFIHYLSTDKTPLYAVYAKYIDSVVKDKS